MVKTKLALALVQDLRNLASSLEAFIRQNQPIMGAAKLESAKIETPESEPATLDMVRAKMIQKSQAGKQAEIKALITKYGAVKLTDINPSLYEKLLKEVGEI